MDYQTFKDIRELVGVIASDLADGALQGLTNALADIAKQTLYTYLQGSEHEPTIRIDNQTGQAWRLVTKWDSTTMESTVKWEPWAITVDEPKPAEPAVEKSSAEPSNGEFRLSHHPGETHPYGVEYFHYGQWCPVMSPYDDESPLRFMSQGQAQEWIGERAELPF